MFIPECPAAEVAGSGAGEHDGNVPGVRGGGGEPAGAGALAGPGAGLHGGAGPTPAGDAAG